MMSARGWKAGVASTAITPAEPMWLAGWAARRAPATSAAQELHAKALALEDAAGERCVIVTADLIAIPRSLARAVAARVEARWHLPRARLLFNASHTHTGPELRPDKVPFFEIPDEFSAKIPAYLAQLEHALVGVIGAALERRTPVTLHAASAAIGFAHNRRSADGATDRQVPVLTLRRAEAAASDAPLAVLFGYACHNLTLPPAFCQYHGDYAGVAQRVIENRLQGATALFLAGAGADQDPAPRGTLELTAAHGAALAEAVLRAASPAAPPVEGALRVAFEEIALDLQPLPERATLEADLRSDDPPRRRKAAFLLDALARQTPLAREQLCPLQVLQLGGELLLIALGGEPVAAYAQRFRTEFASARRAVWVAGYSNDMFGYLPTQAVQREGGYEGGRAALWSAVPTPLADTAEARVVDAVRRLVRACA